MTKTLAIGAVAAFALFFIMSSPDQAADIVHSSWGFVVDLAHGFSDFLNKLAS